MEHTQSCLLHASVRLPILETNVKLVQLATTGMHCKKFSVRYRLNTKMSRWALLLSIYAVQQ